MYLQLLHMISGTKPVTVDRDLVFMNHHNVCSSVQVFDPVTIVPSHLLQQDKQKVDVAIILISIYILIRT